MTGEQLSPEELKALLNRNTDESSTLKKIEQEALLEILSITIGSCSTQLAEAAGQEISIGPPQIKFTSKDTLVSSLQSGLLGILQISTPIDGMGAIITPNTLEQNVSSNWIATINNAFNKSLSTVLSTSVDWQVKGLLENYDSSELVKELQDDSFALVSNEVMGLGTNKELLTLVLPLHIAKGLLSPVVSDINENQEQVAVSKDDNNETSSIRQKEAHTEYAPTVKPAQFSEFGENTNKQIEGNNNLNMLMDIPLKVTVELGRTKRLVKDILELSQGSIIELEKVAGEPVDILVNEKLIAKGEVVVIDENFGVRITEILSTYDRISKLT